MADEPVRTEVRIDEGWIDFQEYFVHRRQGPEVREVRFSGDNRPTEAVVEAIAAADVIVIGPSNPIVSIGPILAGPIRDLVTERALAGVPVVAISPIVGGVALKGPADRMLVSLGHESSARGVARIYRGVATAFVLDTLDADLEPEIAALGLRTLVDRHRHGRPPRPCPPRARRPRVRGCRGRRSGHAPMRIAAIIPVGTLEGAKTRLGGTLDAEERHDLVEDLLARTVASALAVDRLDDVLVISPDPEVLTRAAEIGARTLRQRTSGLNAGLAEARADVDRRRRGGDPRPPDRPAVRHSRGGRGVARAARPSAARRRRPRRARHRPPRHGHQRARPSTARGHRFRVRYREPGRHRAAAEAAGAAYTEVGGPLTVDLDTPEDLVFVEAAETERLGVG